MMAMHFISENVKLGEWYPGHAFWSVPAVAVNAERVFPGTYAMLVLYFLLIETGIAPERA